MSAGFYGEAGHGRPPLAAFAERALAVAGVLALALLICAGCASPGRVALAEWDSRDEAQIRASAAEAEAFYGDGGCGDAKDARAFSAWAELFDMVTKLKVRLRLVSVEWGAAR